MVSAASLRSPFVTVNTPISSQWQHGSPNNPTQNELANTGISHSVNPSGKTKNLAECDRYDIQKSGSGQGVSGNKRDTYRAGGDP
jgi:hypothetical protein